MEVDVDFGFFRILDVDVSVGGGIHPHIQHPKKSGCRPLYETEFDGESEENNRFAQS